MVIELAFHKNIMKSNNILINKFNIILKFFFENKACNEFQELIVEYKKAFVPNLAVLKLSSIKRPFIANLVW